MFFLRFSEDSCVSHSSSSLPLSHQRRLHSFQVNHRLEAVDRRNPMLIRVATVTETDDCRVKVLPDPRPAVCVRHGGRSSDQVCPCRSITTAGPSSLTSGVTETTATSTLLAGVSAQDTHWSRRQVSGQETETGAVAVLKLSCSLHETGSSPVSSPSQGVCPTPGCRGVGHIKGARYTGHHRSEPPA